MIDDRLKRMEEMLANLIHIVGNIRSDQEAMWEEQRQMRAELQDVKTEQRQIRAELQDVKTEQRQMRAELQDVKTEQMSMKESILWLKQEQESMRKEAAERHEEILNRLSFIERDVEHTWEKTARNEREIARVKKQLEANLYRE
ncbi:guided entry of tail-anchored proteins factor 1 [Microaerobacter geothermalis]|uniref:guided entry of tail-anchored proteins factor 1 n=1 Tax=Microaerobacter geothermalis TaxID=674972 RepID=UPI001F2AFACC|nr:guided entry of tail-anchored proteins factor 1 [Microaerobacter geothermalis]MCF6094582.1 guided entry of tail-anchored proteins factor 1 [Microaerobacter geothermalis]